MANVNDYQTGSYLEGEASDELIAASADAGDTGAVPAYRDADGVWQYVRSDEADSYRRRGVSVITTIKAIHRLLGSAIQSSGPFKTELTSSESEHVATAIAYLADSLGDDALAVRNLERCIAALEAAKASLVARETKAA